MNRVTLTAIGRDRPGIVAGVTEVLYRLECNLEETTMTRLRGEFAMILIVLLPEGLSLEKLKEEVEEKAGEMGLTTALRELAEEEGVKKRLDEPPDIIVSVYGADKPGIVYRLSKAMAEKGLNITGLDTRTAGGAETPVYIMVIEASLPGVGVSVGEVEDDLLRMGREVGVDITVKPILSAEL